MNEDLQLFPMFAVGIETIVFLVVLGISALFNWLAKRGEANDWTKESAPRPDSTPRQPPVPPRAPTPPRTTNWEEELRRMLDVPPPVQTPPPVIPPQRTPPPLPRSTPPPVPTTHRTPTPPQPVHPRMYRAHCDNCGGHIEFASNLTGETVRCPHCFHQTTLHPFGDTPVERMQHKPDLSSYKEAAAAFQRASRTTSASSRFQESSKHIRSTSSTDRRHRSAEIEEIAVMLRNPRTARQAIVASVIIGPPKALE